VSHHAHSVKTGLTIEENEVSVQEVAIHDTSEISMRIRFSARVDRWKFRSATFRAQDSCSVRRPCRAVDVVTRFPEGLDHGDLERTGALHLNVGIGVMTDRAEKLTFPSDFRNSPFLCPSDGWRCIEEAVVGLHPRLDHTSLGVVDVLEDVELEKDDSCSMTSASTHRRVWI
jgi:hypothetical protein